MIKYGKNNKENWQIIKEADPSDIWFHLDSFPSCHVIFHGVPSKNDIIDCATLCKEKSKYRNLKNLKIVYTVVNNLRLGEEVGSVYFKSVKKCNHIII